MLSCWKSGLFLANSPHTIAEVAVPVALHNNPSGLASNASPEKA